MKIKLLFLSLILFIKLGFSQEICTYKGMILSADLPVYDASVTAFDEKNKSVGYVFSDNQGEFELKMPCGKKYELEIEHVNYKSKVVKVNLDKSKREKITLEQDAVNLKEIVAKGRIPIQIKGDTIEYDAKSFQTGNEETLEDILKKLPGLTVEKGKVYYQGKEMKSIKVEGREIFGGNQKLLTKNLPSDAVDKVQLNKKFKSNPFANSLQQDEEFELNIVLEEDKKNLVFGNVTIGGDANKHTDLQEKLFYFSKKTDATLISDYNTYGKEVFTGEDYYQFLGGLSEFSSEGGTSSLRNAMGSVGFNSDNNASETDNFLSAGNLGYQPNKNLTISGFAMGTRNAVKYKSTNKRIYPTFEQRDENINEQSIFAFISRLNLEYNTPNNAQLKYRVNFNQQNSDDKTNVTSFLNEDTTPQGYRNSDSKRENATINQKLSYIKKVGEDDNIGIYLSHIYQKENPEIALNSTIQPFVGFLNLILKNNEYQLSQNQDLYSNTFQALSIYNHLLTNLSNLELKVGVNYTKQNLESNLFSFDTPVNGQNTLGEADFSFQEYYANTTYTRKIGKLKANLGVSVNYFNSDNKVKNDKDNSLNGTKFLPHANLSYEINSNQSVYLNYNTSYEIPNVREWTTGYDIKNYYSLFQGNPFLTPIEKQNISLSYRYFNFFKFFNIWTRINYVRTKDNIRNKGTNNGQNQFSTPFNASIPDNFLSGNIRMSKRFSKSYELKLSANANQSEYHAIANNKEYQVNSFFHNYGLTNIFKWNKIIEISLGADATFNKYSGITENKFTNIRPFINTAFVISDRILLEADYDYNRQFQNGNFINDNQGLNASLRIKPAKKTYIKLIAGNILNSDAIVSNGFNDFYTYINTKQTLGRYFILQLRYKF
ncbi:TonB-dependent receptor [Weeksellaceae bacterium TAE3-ERU29]|nr:TonB-dependent receptor [Weeksellaceae bacterium TAE3-ERU29]